MEMSSRDILPCETSASLAESKTSSSPPLASSAERTSTLPSDAARKWTDPSHPLAWDHAGDLSWDPLPLPDLEPEPDKPDELKELHLDPRSDTEPPPEEEEPDREQHREGDLVHLHLIVKAEKSHPKCSTEIMRSQNSRDTEDAWRNNEETQSWKAG